MDDYLFCVLLVGGEFVQQISCHEMAKNLLEGIGDRKCLTIGEPPVRCLRGEVRMDGQGVPKVFDCAFVRAF